MTQDETLSVLKTGANVFLTGEPGSGKTHTVSRYVAYLRAYGIEPAITASTGIAATHIGGMTIHAWSGIGVRNTLSRDEAELLAGNNRLAARVARAKVLIVDEISMLSAGTLSAVDMACRALRKDKASFGGLQVVLVGDFFQLPPVTRENEPPAQFAFYSPSWDEAAVSVCYLSEQYRQDDLAFLSFLAKMRRGAKIHETSSILRAHQTNTVREGNHAHLYAHNVDVDRMNEERLATLPGDARAFAMESHGAKALVAQLKRGCLSPERLLLKPGAKVLFTKNNFEEGFVNGTVGEVEHFSDDDGYPLIRTHAGRCIHALPMEWSIMDGAKTLARIRQVPLKLAWAITVHKSQGMTLDAAKVDLSRAFEYGQGYVALSRVRSFDGLSLLGWNERALEVHPDILARDEGFRKLSGRTGAELAERMPALQEAREKKFILACGGAMPKPHPRAPVAARTRDRRASEGAGFASLRMRYANAYRPWSVDDDTKLKDLFSRGVSVRDCAERFGRQPSAIRSRLAALELRRSGKWPK
ncbi:MAG: PIF1 family ATP-dependent DNA helicase [Candidatus Jorgensenbacteria bacterium]|nr:PIF1 family ATP-dependent DNA helicase [Candidatus Jorgensenbacteria bacterium]